MRRRVRRYSVLTLVLWRGDRLHSAHRKSAMDGIAGLSLSGEIWF
jgi:hypothetical protein